MKMKGQYDAIGPMPKGLKDGYKRIHLEVSSGYLWPEKRYPLVLENIGFWGHVPLAIGSYVVKWITVTNP